METKTKFNATDCLYDLPSSLVNNVFYNKNSCEMLVVLRSGEAYCYNAVPEYAFEEFATTRSPGRWFSTVKYDYGPCIWHNDGDSVLVNVVQKLPEPLKIVWPENLDTDDKAEGVNTASGPTRPTYVQVVFDANGSERTWTTLSETTAEGAVEALKVVAEALGVDFIVKKVIVNFE